MATKQQVPVIAARLVEFQEEFLALSTEDGQWVIQNGKEAAKLLVSAVANRAKEAAQAVISVLSNVISSISTVFPTTKKFVTKDKFVINTDKKAEVKISFLSDNFIKWFLGKNEEPFPGSNIYGHKLEKNSIDGPILAELGGQEKAETTLAEIYAMMLAQPNGKSGELLNDGWANIFYVRDIDGTLRAVDVNWNGVGWNVDAYSVEYPNAWCAGNCVFSRNSLVA